MRVDQARGGTNRPGVATEAFAMPAAMRMRYDAAAPGLADCVSGYAIYIADGRAPAVNWYLPAPAMITVTLDAGPVAVSLRARDYAQIDRASVWGPTSHAYRTTTHGGVSVGIGLTAEGWARLTTRHADAFRDRVAPLATVAGAGPAAELVASLDALDDDAAIAPLLDRLLPDFFAPAPAEAPLLRALDRLIVTDGIIAVADVAARLGIDARTLRGLATRRHGMTSKTLLTRARFVRSFARWLLAGAPASYAGIDASYYDSAHFLLDARHFLDDTPRRFARRETDYLRASLRVRAAVMGAPAHALHAIS